MDLKEVLDKLFVVQDFGIITYRHDFRMPGTSGADILVPGTIDSPPHVSYFSGDDTRQCPECLFDTPETPSAEYRPPNGTHVISHRSQSQKTQSHLFSIDKSLCYALLRFNGVSKQNKIKYIS